MPVVIKCPHCRGRSRIKEEWAGAKVKCPACGEVVVVPRRLHQQAQQQPSKQLAEPIANSLTLTTLLDELGAASASAGNIPAPANSGSSLRLGGARPRRRKKTGRSNAIWFAGAAVTAAVLLVCGGIVMTIRSGSRRDAAGTPLTDANGTFTSTLAQNAATSPLEAEVARIHAAGEPVTVAELDAFYAEPSVDQDATQLWLTAIEPLDKPQFKSIAAALPSVGLGPQSIPLPGEAWPQLAYVEQLLLSYRQTLDQIHQAAARGGRARFPLRFAEGANMPLNHLEQLRSAIRLLTLDSAVAAHRGQFDAAVDSVVAMFAVVRSIEQEPTIVSQLVRIAMSGMAYNQTEWLLAATSLDDAQLARLDAQLAAIDYGQPLRRALVGERVIGMLGFTNPALVLVDVEPKIINRLPKSAEDEPMYLRIMSEMIAAAGETGAARNQAAARAEARLRDLAGTRGAKQRYPLTMLITPAITACVSGAARSEGGREVACAVIAIERFHRKGGRFPTKLDELVPDFFASVPLDPCDGAPLRYRNESTEYLIYSVGPDGIDDNGRRLVDGTSGDVIMRVRIK